MYGQPLFLLMPFYLYRIVFLHLLTTEHLCSLVGGSRENTDDFIPSEPWDGDDFCNDHVDEGNGDTDVEDAVDLITKPRQVRSFFLLPSLVRHFGFVCLYWSLVLY